jgi:hypothetical protein
VAPRHKRWVERDDYCLEDDRFPDGTHAREASALMVGNDGKPLREAIVDPSTPT